MAGTSSSSPTEIGHTASAVRPWPCPASSTTPDPHDRYRRVRVTHPFHPLHGRDFEFVAYRDRTYGIGRSTLALPRIVNYTRSARSVPTCPGDAPIPPAAWPGLRVRRLPRSDIRHRPFDPGLAPHRQLHPIRTIGTDVSG